jgi:hypothetical protein
MTEVFLDQYNKEIDDAEAEIDLGNYIDHADVEKLFTDRRKNLNADYEIRAQY